MPTTMLNPVYNTDGKKNNDLVNVIKSWRSNLKNEIEKMSENEIEIEKPYKIVDILERIKKGQRL